MNEPPKDEGLDRFEQHLREFCPVAPRALATSARHTHWGALAVAAVVLVAIALSLTLSRSRHSVGTSIAPASPEVMADTSVVIPVTLGKLNAALRTSDQNLNQVLDRASPQLLPREHRGTALFELGKE